MKKDFLKANITFKKKIFYQNLNVQVRKGNLLQKKIIVRLDV